MKIATFRPIGPRYAPGPPVVAPVCRLRSPIPSPPSADDIHPNPSPSTADVLPTPQSPSAAYVCLVHRLRLPMASPDPLLPFAGNARPIRCLRPPLTSRLRPMLTSAAIRPRSPRGCAAAKLTPQKKRCDRIHTAAWTSSGLYHYAYFVILAQYRAVPNLVQKNVTFCLYQIISNLCNFFLIYGVIKFILLVV